MCVADIKREGFVAERKSETLLHRPLYATPVDFVIASLSFFNFSAQLHLGCTYKVP